MRYTFVRLSSSTLFWFDFTRRKIPRTTRSNDRFRTLRDRYAVQLQPSSSSSPPSSRHCSPAEPERPMEFQMRVRLRVRNRRDEFSSRCPFTWSVHRRTTGGPPQDRRCFCIASALKRRRKKRRKRTNVERIGRRGRDGRRTAAPKQDHQKIFCASPQPPRSVCGYR